MKQLELDLDGQKTLESITVNEHGHTSAMSTAPLFMKHSSITLPKSSGWEVVIGGENGLRIDPGRGKLPCWFHRKMQELILGFVWRKKA